MDTLEAVESVTSVGFEVTTLNELLARPRPASRQLFGEMWLTGELSVMFAEAGCGKSVLGVQIADCISRGKALPPIAEKPKRQKVIYLDLESSPEQFCSRYTHEESIRFKPYAFSPNFIHARPGAATVPTTELIEQLIESTGAKVLVIDNLAHMINGYSSTEVMRVMRELRGLCRRDGVSILLLAHSRPANLRRGIESRDVPFGETITAVADNVFAIGRVGADPVARYIKHLRPGAAAHVFGAAHVPWFRIRKRSNFIFFEFRGFAREAALRMSDDDRREWQLIDRIGELKKAGMTVRDIGRTLEISKSTVQKYAVIGGHERPLEWINQEETPAVCKHVKNQDPANEFDVSGWAWGEASGLHAEDSHDHSDMIPSAAEDLFFELPPEIPKAEPPVDNGPRSENPLLEPDLDSNGRDIWVEKRDHRGRPLVWYRAQTNDGVPSGKYSRMERVPGLGSIGRTINALPTEPTVPPPPG